LTSGTFCGRVPLGIALILPDGTVLYKMRVIQLQRHPIDKYAKHPRKTSPTVYFA
jgi:hypothetical protein